MITLLLDIKKHSGQTDQATLFQIDDFVLSLVNEKKSA